MKTLSFFQITLFVLVLFISQNAQAQWVQNTNTKNITTNSTFNANSNARVGIGTNAPLAKLHVSGDAMVETTLKFPNTLGNKLSFWKSGPDNDFGIGINPGVMQLYTAGYDKIAMGYGNTNNFKETIRFMTGHGEIGFQNTLGNKITFWSNGPSNDFGIGINPGVMQIYTAGQDKIAFGYGNANNFNETMTFFTGSGQLGIGTSNLGGYKLSVNGTIRAKEIRVETNWADYVFASDYQLRPLEEVEAFIKENKHLPEIPSASEIQENGLDVAATTTKMMAKIEELTLYLIDLKKENDALKVRVQALEKQ